MPLPPKPQGLDVAEFLLAAGPSEPLRPLAAVASGGESARVMLALKAAPAAAAAGAAAAARAATSTGGAGSPGDASDGGDDLEGDVEGGSTPVLVLDELDSGVGSRLGHSVGRLLRRMCGEGGGGAAASQVLCVTHLPQVGGRLVRARALRSRAVAPRQTTLHGPSLLHSQAPESAPLAPHHPPHPC